MKVQITDCCVPTYWYADKIGSTYEVVNCAVNNHFEVPHVGFICVADCILLPEEPGNRIPFSYETWKEKGGNVWENHSGNEVTQIQYFETNHDTKYAGVCNGLLIRYAVNELSMSAPDRVEYFNVYEDYTASSHQSKPDAISSWIKGALHILEVNHTQGTCKIVHRYNTEK